jgi:hypothetical protein
MDRGYRRQVGFVEVSIVIQIPIRIEKRILTSELTQSNVKK